MVGQSSTGGLKLTASVTDSKTGTGDACLCVSDRGHGFDMFGDERCLNRDSEEWTGNNQRRIQFLLYYLQRFVNDCTGEDRKNALIISAVSGFRNQ